MDTDGLQKQTKETEFKASNTEHRTLNPRPEILDLEP